MVLEWILLSTFLISLIAFLGAITLALNEKLFKKILIGLVALSAGALMGGAFLHLIPEAIETYDNTLTLVLIGFVAFFFIEKVFYLINFFFY